MACRIFANGYSARMTWSRAIVLLSALILASNAFCSETAWPGEYANNHFLKGQAAFQLTIEESGGALQVSLNAAYNDGHGAAPDGQGEAKITGDNTLQFKWQDSFKNAGTGRIARAGEDIIVSMKTTRIVDSRCLVFYGHKMRLKPVKK
jgi:hypothetical protein